MRVGQALINAEERNAEAIPAMREKISQFPKCSPQTMKGFRPRAASSNSSAGSKTMRSLSVSVLMRKLSAKVRPRFSHIAAAIALRSAGDFSGKACSIRKRALLPTKARSNEAPEASGEP